MKSGLGRGHIRIPHIRLAQVAAPQFRAVLLALLLTAFESAQVTTGSIVGTARDSSGAVTPGAIVTITNVRTNAARTDTTDANGDYVISALPPKRLHN